MQHGIAGCTGTKLVQGQIAREVVYRLLKKKFVLICTPALSAGVEEDVEFVKKYPGISIDGRGKECCTKILREKGAKIFHSINIENIIEIEGREYGSPLELNENGRDAINKIIKEVKSKCK